MFGPKFTITDSQAGRFLAELSRLNDNFERFLASTGANRLPTAAELAAAETRTFVGEPLSDVEMALKEHAAATGQMWGPSEEPT